MAAHCTYGKLERRRKFPRSNHCELTTRPVGFPRAWLFVRSAFNFVWAFGPVFFAAHDGPNPPGSLTDLFALPLRSICRSPTLLRAGNAAQSEASRIVRSLT